MPFHREGSQQETAPLPKGAKKPRGASAPRGNKTLLTTNRTFTLDGNANVSLAIGGRVGCNTDIFHGRQLSRRSAGGHILQDIIQFCLEFIVNFQRLYIFQFSFCNRCQHSIHFIRVKYIHHKRNSVFSFIHIEVRNTLHVFGRSAFIILHIRNIFCFDNASIIRFGQNGTNLALQIGIIAVACAIDSIQILQHLALDLIRAVSTSAAYGHWVCVVGIRADADPANLKESDFYALDPARVSANGTLAVTRLLDGTIWTDNSPLKTAG